MSEQLMFYIDINKCIHCKTCEMACNDYYHLTGVHRRKVVSFGSDQSSDAGYVTISCGHCRNPVCVYICPENNFQKRQDGIVVHNSNNCRSCKRCITACPFHAPKLNPATNRADKCNFCVERIDQGLKPICVENCITGALNVIKVDINEMTIQNFYNVENPIQNYTNPSIIVTKKQKGTTFLRKG